MEFKLPPDVTVDVDPDVDGDPLAISDRIGIALLYLAAISITGIVVSAAWVFYRALCGLSA